MDLEKIFIDEFNQLPHEKQLVVIDFIQYLKAKHTPIERMMDEIIRDNFLAFKELADK